MKESYSISVVDANSLSCEGLKRALRSRSFTIHNRWANIEEALDAASPEIECKAILINLSKQGLPSPDTMKRFRSGFPHARIALIGESNDPERVRQATQLELDGFLLETVSLAALSKAIELIILGVQVFPVLLPDQVESPEPLAPPKPASDALGALSASELRVLALLAKARANKVIARDLGISESTVKVHVKAILRKTGSRNRTDAALLVRDVGAIGYLEELAQTILDNTTDADNEPLNGRQLPLFRHPDAG
jgi:two-component system nitrate/nitrite response regulator NarL